MTDLRDPDVIADEFLPLGGPYTPEAMAAAAALAAELVRRLNHATFSPDLDYPSQVDAIVGGLAGAVGGLPQLLGQLADALHKFNDWPGMYADEMADGVSVRGVIDKGWCALRRASGHTWHATDELITARIWTARLGIHADDEE